MYELLIAFAMRHLRRSDRRSGRRPRRRSGYELLFSVALRRLPAETAHHLGFRLIRAASEVARWVSAQLELAELDRSRTRLAEAEVKALRAQISPHFIYNSLGAIASFVRTDPDRARSLVLAFADYVRSKLARPAEFVTLDEELRHVQSYLDLEQARFGEQLELGTAVPS